MDIAQPMQVHNPASRIASHFSSGVFVGLSPDEKPQAPCCRGENWMLVTGYSVTPHTHTPLNEGREVSFSFQQEDHMLNFVSLSFAKISTAARGTRNCPKPLRRRERKITTMSITGVAIEDWRELQSSRAITVRNRGSIGEHFLDSDCVRILPVHKHDVWRRTPSEKECVGILDAASREQWDRLPASTPETSCLVGQVRFLLVATAEVVPEYRSAPTPDLPDRIFEPWALLCILDVHAEVRQCVPWVPLQLAKKQSPCTTMHKQQASKQGRTSMKSTLLHQPNPHPSSHHLARR